MIIRETEDFIDGTYIEEFRAKNYGNSKILTAENYVEILIAFTLQSNTTA